jgi:hypothetical protein
MTLAVGRRILTSETQVRSQASSYCVATLVCIGWGSNGAGLLPVLRFFLFCIIRPLLHTHSSVYHRRHSSVYHRRHSSVYHRRRITIATDSAVK